MQKASIKDKSKLINNKKVDELFEKTLRPLQSNKSRNIFLVLKNSENEYLTTYDIQPILEYQGIKLSKVELNNWLSSLQSFGLVEKALKRGKPTTRSYNRHYTFDLWKLSKKGRETANLLDFFKDKMKIQARENLVEKIIEKVVKIPKLPNLLETSFKDIENIQNISMHLNLLKTLYRKDSMNIVNLSNETGFTTERIVEFIENNDKSSSKTLYFLIKEPMDLREKILQKIGLKIKKNYAVSLSPEGEKTSRKLFSQHLYSS